MRDALVVGGSVDDRLAARHALMEQGFRVTVERSELRGLARLQRHRYVVCHVDLARVARPRALTANYTRAAQAHGTELRLRAGDGTVHHTRRRP